MNDTKIASKTKAQLAHFMGKVFTHFPKPSKKFVEECIYGIQASGDTKLSSIVRAIDDDIRPIYTEKRLSRNLDDEVLKIVKAVYAATGGKGTFKSQWRIVEAYLSRWRIEEAIRFVKQSYGFENIRVITYARIRNMASLVLASAYFATAWIGRNIRREVLAEHLAHLGKRLGEVPEFAAYAIADGIKRGNTRSR